MSRLVRSLLVFDPRFIVVVVIVFNFNVNFDFDFDFDITGHRACVTVIAHDASNRPDLQLRPTAISVVIDDDPNAGNVSIVSSGQGVFNISFSVQTPGAHILAVKLFGEPFMGSPFVVQASSKVSCKTKVLCWEEECVARII
jgi:hypothetical protein